MQDSSTLIVKHLPAELSLYDREEFIKLFGAKKVRCFSDESKMKYTAFAMFDSDIQAKQALQRLHQLELLNRKLVVEFVKTEPKSILFKESSDSATLKSNQQDKPSSKLLEKEELKIEDEKFSKMLHGVCSSLGLDYIPSSLLKYKYPPPTPTIIANISHALASVPKFYTQVLHLMNKLNLPTPFGSLTPAPPFVPDNLVMSYDVSERDADQIKEMDTSSSSEEESELESDNDNINNQKTNLVLPFKRQNKKTQKQRKKPKFHQPTVSSHPQSGSRTEPSEVFETGAQLDTQKKILFNIKPTLKSDVLDSDPVTLNEKQSGFGIIVSSKLNNEETNEGEESGDEHLQISQFISSRELREKRLSHAKMKTLSIFQNYNPGEPTVRLYIKNLAKQVEEKDLRYIFGRFINLNSETDRNMFDIRLMKEGRMKGQAFVTLANEKQAIEAVKETNGFVLHTKPLVVQFARSAKPKDTQTK